MITFLHCQDRVCQECVAQYITTTIRDKNIMKLVCPVCGKPENLDDEVVATEYFNNFDIMVRQVSSLSASKFSSCQAFSVILFEKIVVLNQDIILA